MVGAEYYNRDRYSYVDLINDGNINVQKNIKNRGEKNEQKRITTKRKDGKNEQK